MSPSSPGHDVSVSFARVAGGVCRCVDLCIRQEDGVVLLLGRAEEEAAELEEDRRSVNANQFVQVTLFVQDSDALTDRPF